jgi:hypothetical protein
LLCIRCDACFRCSMQPRLRLAVKRGRLSRSRAWLLPLHQASRAETLDCSQPHSSQNTLHRGSLEKVIKCGVEILLDSGSDLVYVIYAYHLPQERCGVV